MMLPHDVALFRQCRIPVASQYEGCLIMHMHTNDTRQPVLILQLTWARCGKGPR